MKIAPLALAAVLGMPLTASAQHASFVLFGEPNADAASVTPERTFVHPVTSPYYHERQLCDVGCARVVCAP